MRHLKTNEGGGDLVSVMLNGSGGSFSAATRTPARWRWLRSTCPNCTARGRRPNGPAFKESLNQVTELLRDVGIIDDISSTILAFQPTSSMNDSAATLARTAARL